jgi:succinoglycan biosynthesis transport protein ExoP
MDNDFEERSSLESILDYTQTLWRWLWLLLLVALATGAVAYYITNQQPRVYQSSSRAIVNVVSRSDYYDSYTASYTSQRLAETYAQTMVTEPLLQAVSEKLGYPLTGTVKATSVENSPIFVVTVTDSDPRKAADTANAVVDAFAEKVVRDQSSRFQELKASLEVEIATLDEKLSEIYYQLSLLEMKDLEYQAALDRNVEREKAGLEPIEVNRDPQDYVNKAELELIKSQYQSNRASLFTNLQSIRLTEVQSATTISQLNQALPDEDPIQPQPLRSAGLAALVGFMLAAGVVFLVAYLEDEIRDPSEITQRWGVPVIGVITSFAADESPLITLNKPRMPVSEAFRSLRTNLQFSGIDAPLRTLLVTSPSPSDGKSSIAANLATVMAQSDKDVVIVDGDMRRPTIHKVFKLSNRLGLSDYFLRAPDKMSGVVKKTPVNNLSIITSGSLPPNPSELLSSTKMRDVIALLAKHFDMVILDSPPLLAVTDALVLTKNVDGVILVVDPKKTKRSAIKQAIEQLQRVNARLLGVVLNNIKIKRSSYYYNREYYYTKHYGITGGEPSPAPVESEDAGSTG